MACCSPVQLGSLVLTGHSGRMNALPIDDGALRTGRQLTARCQTEQRRRRLLNILDRENVKTSIPTLRGAQSLPSLSTARQPPESIPSVEKPANTAMLTTRRRNLSPLKTRRVQQSTPQQKNEFSSLEEAMVDDQAQIKEEARLIKAFEDWEKQRSRAVAKHYKLSQLEQSRAKEERRLERKLDNMVIQEQMEWERTQLELVEQAQRQARGNQRRLLRDEHARTLEIDRRREGAAKITRHFFDRLAVLDPEPALEMFTAKRDELVRCCLELMRDFADDNEIEAFQAELQESLQREVNTLRCRQRAFQQEQRVQTHKKQVHQDMRRAQYQEIQTHLQAKRDTRTTDRVVREEIDKQHDLQDQRYRAMQARKKQKDLDVHTKLLEQMRLKQAEKAVVSLRIEGKTSPVLRTPYWSDEAQEAQLDTFVRSSPIVQAPESPVIRGKVRCQWYD